MIFRPVVINGRANCIVYSDEPISLSYASNAAITMLPDDELVINAPLDCGRLQISAFATSRFVNERRKLSGNGLASTWAKPLLSQGQPENSPEDSPFHFARDRANSLYRSTLGRGLVHILDDHNLDWKLCPELVDCLNAFRADLDGDIVAADVIDLTGRDANSSMAHRKSPVVQRAPSEDLVFRTSEPLVVGISRCGEPDDLKFSSPVSFNLQKCSDVRE